MSLRYDSKKPDQKNRFVAKEKRTFQNLDNVTFSDRLSKFCGWITRKFFHLRKCNVPHSRCSALSLSFLLLFHSNWQTSAEVAEPPIAGHKFDSNQSSPPLAPARCISVCPHWFTNLWQKTTDLIGSRNANQLTKLFSF